MTHHEKQTHFGFQSVPWEEKEQRVGEVFHSVAERYDLMNDLMSLGLHRLWKRFAIELAGLRPGQSVLDLACGSGDLSERAYHKVTPGGQVVLADINSSMLSLGRDKLMNKGLYEQLHYVQANAENLPFANSSFHCIMMGFGLRNVTDKQTALQSMFRVCKPGGKLLILEFSKPQLPGLSPVYDYYSFHVLPKLGKLFANDSQSYQYLAESIRMHPSQEELKNMIETAGFEDCYYHHLFAGIVALHIAYKY
jgi:demethylmenaquinone methyltransferase/2-methoxy-6-polyprenyl-1,4-benzoquinol methylase